jgi:NADPH-dependent 7-cyano-7-deazaguanine reductase QueF
VYIMTLMLSSALLKSGCAETGYPDTFGLRV